MNLGREKASVNVSEERRGGLAMRENQANDTNQHYITKAHLDKFVQPESTQPVLCPYRKGGTPCRPTGTKRLGSDPLPISVPELMRESVRV
jgi:hypothetical protein